MSAPTMAESITTLEQECARLDSTVAALRLEQELAPPNGSWWQALKRNREPMETLAAHYRNALGAMRNQQASSAEPVRFEYRLRHQDGTWYPWDTPSHDNTREERDRAVRLARQDGIEAEARDLYEVPNAG